MQRESLNRDWTFQRGTYMLIQEMTGTGKGKRVQLPHDYMIGSEVREDAPGQSASGYYTEGVGTYTKRILVPREWQGEKIYLHFDGVMMNASVRVNGSLVTIHHYGYTPFLADLTDALYYGEENRIEVIVNPSMQPNSRWYSGAGIYRHVEISHVSPLHIAADGIFAYTRRLVYEGEKVTEAHVTVEVTVENHLLVDHQIKVRAILAPEGSEDGSLSRESTVLVKAGAKAVARIPMTVTNPALWDAESPQLYNVKAETEDMGVFGICLTTTGQEMKDSADTLFGIRMITADATRGLQINGRTVKLKGGCIHHDNGLLGAVSLYDSEYRRMKALKDADFNAVRLAHNPPSRELLEVCDRIGLYVFNEAFDAWGHGKQPGDYNQFFHDHWQEDMAAFIIRDRNHPSIIFWSTGNEVEERGGIGNGYAWAEELASYVRTLDTTRLVTNGLCSFWSGLDDKTQINNYLKMKKLAEAGENVQNSDPFGSKETAWEDRTEAFVNCLDVVGYNYLDAHYEYAGERYPERVIIGTESFPKEFDKVWDLVERLPYVIGDFTWTALDYIGEAGIGKSGFFKADDPILKQGPYALSSHISQYPWRLANDADFTINSMITPQGTYRKIVWGSSETGLYTQHPQNHDLVEIVSQWGWPQMSAEWNYSEYAGKPVKVYVYSAAEEVELLLNSQSLGKEKAGKHQRYTAVFEVPYEAGELVAVSYTEGQEVSRQTLQTTGWAEAVHLITDKADLKANGESLAYVMAEIVDAAGNVVPNAEIALQAEVAGDSGIQGEAGAEPCAYLAGFGSDRPITEENYTTDTCTSYQGRAFAVVRSGYQAGEVTVTISAAGLNSASVVIRVEN